MTICFFSSTRQIRDNCFLSRQPYFRPLILLSCFPLSVCVFSLGFLIAAGLLYIPEKNSNTQTFFQTLLMQTTKCKSFLVFFYWLICKKYKTQAYSSCQFEGGHMNNRFTDWRVGIQNGMEWQLLPITNMAWILLCAWQYWFFHVRHSKGKNNSIRKSGMRETLNILTYADISTDTKKKYIYIYIKGAERAIFQHWELGPSISYHLTEQPFNGVAF